VQNGRIILRKNKNKILHEFAEEIESKQQLFVMREK